MIAKLNGIKTIIRSVRNSIDFNYEQIMNDINFSQKQGIDTVLFFSKQTLSHISSTAVKELQKNYGSIIEYVPLNVKEALERKISEQYLLGVTGEIGAGKSFVSKKLMEMQFRYGDEDPISNIDMDDIGRKILTEYTEPLFVEAREKLIRKIGKRSLQEECGKIDLQKMTNLMFLDAGVLSIFNEIMTEPILFEFRRRLQGLKGIILVNSALFAEAGLSYLTNNNILMVTADKKERIKRLKKRGYNSAGIEARLNVQLTWEAKYNRIHKEIENTQHGEITIFDNTAPSPKEFKNLFNSLFVGE